MYVFSIFCLFPTQLSEITFEVERYWQHYHKNTSSNVFCSIYFWNHWVKGKTLRDKIVENFFLCKINVKQNNSQAIFNDMRHFIYYYAFINLNLFPHHPWGGATDMFFSFRPVSLNIRDHFLKKIRSNWTFWPDTGSVQYSTAGLSLVRRWVS